MNIARGVRTAFAVAITLGVSMVVLTQSAYASPTGGIGGRPANPDPNNPRTQSIFIYSLATGQTKDDQVLISNNSDKAQTISFYAVDGVVTNTGAYTCKQKSEALVDAGGWVKIAKNTITLNPNASEKVNFTVAVPSGAGVGEHSACIVFQNDDDEGEAIGSVRLRTRQAIRMAVTIPGDLRRTVSIDTFSIAVEKRMQKFNVSLHNTGNVSADVAVNVTLKNILGGVEYQTNGQYPVIRDQKLDLSFGNTELPFWGGWYIARVDASYGKSAGSFGVPDAKDKLTVVSSEPIRVFVAPSGWAWLIYLLIILIIVALISRPFIKRELAKRRMNSWEHYIVREGDSIQSIADTRNISWKKLARINELKAPYVVVVGSRLEVPSIYSEDK